jgi:hypothetical protein
VRRESGASRCNAPATAHPAAGGLTPEGTYECLAWDAGLLHRQGEFVLRPGGRYEDLWDPSRGRWSHDPATGVIRFTGGTLDNGAAARLVRNAQGHILVEFTWRPEVTRECYRMPG